MIPDLRSGSAPLPPPSPGVDLAGDARALWPASVARPAAAPVPGTQKFGSLAPGQRYVVRIPQAWNGDLVVCGTPAMRSEGANDAILGDWLLARGYATAWSNKGIPFNAIVEPLPPNGAPPDTYPIPFPMGDAPPGTLGMRFGALEHRRGGVRSWHEDLPLLVQTARARVRLERGREPGRTYAVGLSIGGAQVRSLAEHFPELVDGALEWASVYWSPDENVLTYMPAFLREMQPYAASGYADAEAAARIVAAGYPPDRRQPDPAHPSLWDEHFSRQPPFYADLTVFAFGRLLDPESGPLDALAARSAYVPSARCREGIAAWGHTGAIGVPLVSVAGDADVFITPQRNLDPYVAAVRAAGRSDRHWTYVVEDGTHADPYCAFGYGLQPQVPFAWAAFERLVGIVERGERAGAGEVRRVREPREIA